jgi:hypothetical protein
MAQPRDRGDTTAAGAVVSVWEVERTLVSRDVVGEGWSKVLVTSRGERRKVEVTPFVRRGETLVRVRDGEGLQYLTPPGYSQQKNLLILVEAGAKP